MNKQLCGGKRCCFTKVLIVAVERMRLRANWDRWMRLALNDKPQVRTEKQRPITSYSDLHIVSGGQSEPSPVRTLEATCLETCLTIAWRRQRIHHNHHQTHSKPLLPQGIQRRRQTLSPPFHRNLFPTGSESECVDSFVVHRIVAKTHRMWLL